MNKTVAPAALNALKEALTCVYWFRNDLRSFLQHTITDPRILTRLNWDDYKRNIVATLIDYMARDAATYQGDLLRLMYEVVNIRDFSHLEKLDDGRKKAAAAKNAVAALAALVQDHRELAQEQKEAENRRQAKHQVMLRNQGVREKLNELRNEFLALLSETPQRRGYRLETLLRDLFELFDLDPKASFRLVGEQIDGAFVFEGIDYLLESKWQNELVSIQELDAFSGKLARKLENTLGLFISVNGFSEDGIRAHSTGRRLMILMDGSDLMAVLDGRIDLVQLLLRKRRAAAQTGNIYVKIHDIL